MYAYGLIPINILMATNKLYPERQRCASCRKKLENIVVNGIHCSYKCASLTPPASNVSKAPRECKRKIGESWDFKKRYRSESEVSEKLRQDPGTNIYRCTYCYHIHVGHSRPESFSRDKLMRVVGDVETLGSVLQRMRLDKGWSLQRLASHLKVPVIRLKEIESGSITARIDITIAALYAVGIRVILQEK